MTLFAYIADHAARVGNTLWIPGAPVIPPSGIAIGTIGGLIIIALVVFLAMGMNARIRMPGETQADVDARTGVPRDYDTHTLAKDDIAADDWLAKHKAVGDQ